MIDRSGYVGGGSEMCCEWRHGLAKDEMDLGEACVSWSLGLHPWLREREREIWRERLKNGMALNIVLF